MCREQQFLFATVAISGRSGKPGREEKIILK
jgi:hypothetical protein